jgi:hypothetical protein
MFLLFGHWRCHLESISSCDYCLKTRFWLGIIWVPERKSWILLVCFAQRLKLSSRILLVFNCVVAKQLWSILSEILNGQVGTDFVSVGTMWISNRKFIVENIFCAAALWGLWKLRNNMCFQGTLWVDVRVLILKVTAMLHNWSSLCPKEKVPEFRDHLDKLKSFVTRPHRLPGLIRWMINETVSYIKLGPTGRSIQYLMKLKLCWQMELIRRG